MICPKCNRDYKDVPETKEPSGFYHGDDHFYKNYRRFGYRCGNCGFIAEVIARPSGEPYLKRKVYDESQLNIFQESQQ